MRQIPVLAARASEWKYYYSEVVRDVPLESDLPATTAPAQIKEVHARVTRLTP